MANVLGDPDFELGSTIARVNTGDTYASAWHDTPWVSIAVQQSPFQYVYSTANPQSGSRHARVTNEPLGTAVNLWASHPNPNFTLPSWNASTSRGPVAGIVQAGGDVSFSGFINCEAEIVGFQLFLVGVDDGTQITTSDAFLTTSGYESFALQLTAPSDQPYYVLARVGSSGTTGFIDVDNCVLDISDAEPEPEPELSVSSIVRTGFRFPHPKWSRRSTATNLLFLETQLERYMHSHEPVPEEDEGGPPAH